MSMKDTRDDLKLAQSLGYLTAQDRGARSVRMENGIVIRWDPEMPVAERYQLVCRLLCDNKKHILGGRGETTVGSPEPASPAGRVGDA